MSRVPYRQAPFQRMRNRLSSPFPPVYFHIFLIFIFYNIHHFTILLSFVIGVEASSSIDLESDQAILFVQEKIEQETEIRRTTPAEKEQEEVFTLQLEVEEERWPLIFQREYEAYTQKHKERQQKLMEKKMIEDRARQFQADIVQRAINDRRRSKEESKLLTEDFVSNNIQMNSNQIKLERAMDEKLVQKDDMKANAEFILGEIQKPRLFTILVDEDLYRKEYGGRLGVGLDKDLIINSFQSGPKGQVSLLKTGGAVVGDKLVAINDKPTYADKIYQEQQSQRKTAVLLDHKKENDIFKDRTIQSSSTGSQPLYRPRDIPGLIKEAGFPLKLTFLAPNSFVGGNKEEIMQSDDPFEKIRPLFQEELLKEFSFEEDFKYNEIEKENLPIVKALTTNSEKPNHSLIVYDNYDQIQTMEYTITPALFGPPHSSNSDRYPVILAEPLDACSAPPSTIFSSRHILQQKQKQESQDPTSTLSSNSRDEDNTMTLNPTNFLPYQDKIVVAKRGKCSFAYKSHVIASHGGQGLIVVDDVDRGYFTMPIDPQMEKQKLDYVRTSMLTRYDGENLFHQIKSLAKAGRVPLARFQSNHEEVKPDLNISTENNEEKRNINQKLSPKNSFVNAKGIRIENDLKSEEQDYQASLDTPRLLKDLELAHLHFVPSPPNPPFEGYILNENKIVSNLPSKAMDVDQNFINGDQHFLSLHQIQNCDISKKLFFSREQNTDYSDDGYGTYKKTDNIQRGLILWLFDPVQERSPKETFIPKIDNKVRSPLNENVNTFLRNGLSCLNQENQLIENLQSYVKDSVRYLILVIDAENPVHIEYVLTFFNPRYRYFKGNKDHFEAMSKADPSINILVVDQKAGKLLSTMVDNPINLNSHYAKDTRNSVFIEKNQSQEFNEEESSLGVEVENKKGTYWKYLYDTLQQLSSKLIDQSLAWPVSSRGNRRLQQKIDRLYADKLDIDVTDGENKRKNYISKHLSNLPADRRGSFEYML